MLRMKKLAIVFGLMLMLPALGAVDLSSPKSTARSFYDAIAAADSAAIKDCVLAEGADQEKLTSAFIDVILSGKKLGDAAKEKFGSGAERIAAGTISKEEIANIDKAEQKDNGEDSTIQLDKKARPLKFHKTPAGWKLALSDYAGGKDESIDQQIQLLSSLSKSMTDTAQDINQGRYPTSADAEAALQQRFSEALSRNFKPPATSPTTQQK
jgi:hypothetical protein